MLHSFLFKSGTWLGRGKITLTTSPTILNFFVRWKIFMPSETEVRAVQNIELQGVKEHVINYYDITEISPEGFKIIVSSESIGQQKAKGIIEGKKIHWVFKDQSGLSGFESYEQQSNGEYLFHAEYLSEEGDKTIVEGVLWEKITD